MYDIALSVAACRRADTRVDVAWIVDTEQLGAVDPTGALALTPGGGRIGSLLDGALDSQLAELAGLQPSTGRLHDLDVSAIDAAVAGLPAGGRARCVLTPASELPDELWQVLIDRQPACLVSRLDGDRITSTTLYTGATIDDADDQVAERFRSGAASVSVDGDTLVTVLAPTTKLVLVGGGPMVEALVAAGALLGWQTAVAADASTATGLIAGLSAGDCVVVAHHDLEVAGAALDAALDTDAGYIGALGSRRMQQARADWLAYRGVTDLDRVHGPAGLDIGANSPPEVAVAVLAEALGALYRSTPPSGT
ncbi:MAG: XdhC family protein [Acidimicrobiales bacterium]|nr:XdhC family protein [Acidimicrobiales bacterium]